MYLQSEAETLQLDRAWVSEPGLLTALGAWPAPAPLPPGCLPSEGAPPQEPGGAGGRLYLRPGREALRPAWPLPDALGDLAGGLDRERDANGQQQSAQRARCQAGSWMSSPCYEEGSEVQRNGGV